MRRFLAIAIFMPLAAQAQQLNTFRTVPSIDLDKPGALAALEREKPAEYQRVMEEVRRAEKMDCQAEMRLYRAGAILKGGPCRAFLISTSYPAKIRVSVPSGEGIYTITTRIDTAADRVSPAK